MFGVLGAWSFLTAHPVVGLAVLVAVTLGVVVILSGGRMGESIGGMFRVALTFFTTPFIFLRDALTAMRTSEETDQAYRGSRVFMMFRLNRIQYLALLVFCLLMLSSGVTSSVLTLYPSAEIEQGRLLDEQITQLQGEATAARQAVTAASAPGRREQLQAQRNEAREAYQTQIQSNAVFVQNTTFSGPIISQLAAANNSYTIERTRANIDSYMSGCPRGYNWRGMTAESCAQYRAFALALADRKQRELDLADAARRADAAWRQADEAAQIAAANLQNLESRLRDTRAQREAVSLFNPDLITQRLAAAGVTLLATLWSVILAVWVGATFISFFSWCILMMRGLEILQTQKLKEAPPEE